MKYLTPSEVADLLETSRYSVNRWHRDRRLPASNMLRCGDKRYSTEYIDAICNVLIPMMGRWWCVYPEFFWQYHDKTTTPDPWAEVMAEAS